ncbi:MAG: hypothetical protein ABI689_14260 [Thermoanaerobaculia bacterium]
MRDLETLRRLSLTPDGLRRWALVLGLAISALMVTRSQVGGDQLNLLARGWLLEARGVLIPYGNPLSSGGDGPGVATTLLMAGPLSVWRDHRAPVILIWLLHFAAWALLDRRLRSVFTPWERAALAVVYWLNPWRLEASAFLWNPNFLYFFGALHFATAFDQREGPRFGASCLHLLALGVGAQLHPAMLLLIVSSLLLWRRGIVQVHWGGVAAGVAITGVLLVPWWLAAASEPAIVTASSGFPFRGLIWFQPWIKGLSYWLRYPSLLINKQSAIFDFTALAGAGADRLLAPFAKGLVGIAGAATMFAVLLANVDFFRRRFAGGLREAFARSNRVEARQFVGDYAFWSFVAAIVVFAAAPTTPQSWQAVPLFQAAVVPVIFWLGRKLDAPPTADAARRGLVAAATASIAILLALAAGGPNFRCGGRHGVVIPLRAASPMFEELGLQRTCPWPLDVPNEWWPDVLPEE